VWWALRYSRRNYVLGKGNKNLLLWKLLVSAARSLIGVKTKNEAVANEEGNGSSSRHCCEHRKEVQQRPGFSFPIFPVFHSFCFLIHYLLSYVLIFLHYVVTLTHSVFCTTYVLLFTFCPLFM
jgi:hypothetical protein